MYLNDCAYMSKYTERRVSIHICEEVVLIYTFMGITV